MYRNLAWLDRDFHKISKTILFAIFLPNIWFYIDFLSLVTILQFKFNSNLIWINFDWGLRALTRLVMSGWRLGWRWRALTRWPRGGGRLDGRTEVGCSPWVTGNGGRGGCRRLGSRRRGSSGDAPATARRRRGSEGHGEDASGSEEHTSELQSHYSISYAVFCLKKCHWLQQRLSNF